jgi:unsaturated rhamnogalacturonyl hydrolase
MLTKMTPATLSGVDCLIIVDPDIPKENPKPNYIADDEITAIREWVRNGGRLVILGNDAGNAEFEHLNKLNAEFGFTFTETTHHNAQQSGKLSLPLPEHPIFEGAQTFYAVDVAPLKIARPSVQAILSDNGEPIMALTSFGKGKVFALGDPWIYNEYIHSGSNQKIAENLFRYLLW